jgi:MarR family transcriptional regulator, 2-MHQ and catechol-resistance regulon repressor
LSQEGISGVRVWLILWKAAKAMEQTALGSISRVGLGISDFAILELLLHKGPQPVNVIGRKILLTSGSITTAVDRLEAKKLVHRASDPDDRRSRIVALTASGRRLISTAFQQHAADMERAFHALNSRERAALIHLLKKTRPMLA